MKKLQKILSLLVLAAVCFLVPGSGKLTAVAAEPTTYIICYPDGSTDWHYQVGSSWTDGAEHRELYYMLQAIKDGDHVIIQGSGSSDLTIQFPVRLGSLTVSTPMTVFASANGYDNVYALSGTVSSITGNVTNGYVYDNATCNFNNNVGTLNVIGVNVDINANVGVLGTVDHLIGLDNQTTYYDVYQVASGKTVIEDGSLKTDAQYYSTQASAAPAVQPVTSAAQPAVTSGSASQSSGEYDNVPKTGESSMIYWLLGISALCLMGGYALRRKQA